MSQAFEFAAGMGALIVAIQLPVYLVGGWVIVRLLCRNAALRSDVDAAFLRNVAEMPEIDGSVR